MSLIGQENAHGKRIQHLRQILYYTVPWNSILSKFIPFSPEFQKWAHSPLDCDISIVANSSLVKMNNRMTNSVDLDKEPFHLDLHCLQRYTCWSAGMKRLFIYQLLFYFSPNKSSGTH